MMDKAEKLKFVGRDITGRSSYEDNLPFCGVFYTITLSY